jgi:hypothetical protein
MSSDRAQIPSTGIDQTKQAFTSVKGNLESYTCWCRFQPMH